MISDIRLAGRRLARCHGLAVAALATIALGVGATTAIYSALRTVILQPFPYPESDRLVWISENNPQRGIEDFSVPAPTYADWREQTRSFRDLAAQTTAAMILSGDDEPQRVTSVQVSPNWFTMLGVPMRLGRAFTPSDSVSGQHLVVLSSEFWRRRFGGDPAIVGRTLTLNAEPYVVLGVAGPGLHTPADLWVPLAVAPNVVVNRNVHILRVVGRLAPGVTLERAHDELTLISEQLAEQFPESNQGWTARIVFLRDAVAGDAGPALIALMVAVLFVLLIASANVANLLMARGTARTQEYALRIALGARQMAIVRDVLTEAALLSLLGGLAGVSLALAGMRVLRSTAAGIIPRAAEMTLDPSALAVAIGASLLAVAIGGLPPALFATRGIALNRLHQQAAGVGRARARTSTQQGLVVAQTALAIVLLSGALLLLDALIRVRGVDLGLDPKNVAVASITLPRASYADAPAQHTFATELVAQLSALPGVRAAAIADRSPGDDFQGVLYFGIPGRLFDAATQPTSHVRSVTADYFEALGISLIAGRVLLPSDRGGVVPVVVIDELLAQRYFPGGNPLGKHVALANGQAEIVGVVEHVRHNGAQGEDHPAMYIPLMQAGRGGDMSVFVRAETNLEAITRQMRAHIREVGPGVPIYDERTLESRMARSIGATRLFAWLAALFGACAVVLACVGVYGVLAFSVARRTREIGVRMALGAETERVVRDEVVAGLKVTAVGVGLGVCGALWVADSLSANLDTVASANGSSLLLAPLLFLAVAAVACLIPAVRAGRVDPLAALRAH